LAQSRLTLAIRNGLVYDGTGAPPVSADVGIYGDTIASIGKVGDADAVIDATGLAISPGFIDTHGHSEFTLLASPEAEGKLMQGITTEVNGNCGLSAAPLIGPVRDRREADQNEYGIKERWATLKEYFSLLEARGAAINYATLAGQGNIRASVLGYEDRAPSGRELDAMMGLLLDALDEGAIGLSTGLIYPPGVYSSLDEIAALASAGMAHGAGPFIYATHMRSEGERLLESIEETLEVGRRSGCRVHVSHIKTAGRSNWDKASAAIGLMDCARQEGIEATCDRYPYVASATDLDAVFPGWMFEGGTDEELRRLGDPSIILKLRELSGSWPDGFESIRISDVTTEASKWVEGLSILEIAARWDIEPFDAIVRLLVEEGLRVGAIFHSMCEENLSAFLSRPYCMVGSDSSARSFAGVTRRGRPHPRGFGSMPRFLRMAIEGKVDFEDKEDAIARAIGRLTSLPASTFGFELRGQIREGFMADITIFSQERITDTADFEMPFSPPVGVEYVLVNGVPAVYEGRLTGNRQGRVLRHGRKA